MFYFVPSWYRQDRKWYSTTLPFYYVSKNMMFDDAVNLLRMFQQSGEANTTLILNYSPHIRTFLYQQRILPETVWNLFDTIQGLTDVSVRKIRLEDIKWPQGVEFFYTPFMIEVYLNQEHYAKINFSQTGNFFDITYFEGGQTNHQLIFDDRGFVSSVIYFENDQPYYQDYLNLQGTWQFREFLGTENHQVLINPEAQATFAKEVYRDIEELINEKLDQYLTSALTKDDTIVISSDVQHNHFFQKIKENHHVILSFFGDRYPITNQEQLLTDLTDTPFFVVDSLNKIETIAANVDLEQLPGFYEIPPYDTHLNLGHSQRKKELIVYVNYDNLPADQIQYVFTTLFEMMLKNEWIDLLVGTQSQDFGREAYIKQVLESYRSLKPEYEQELIFVDKEKRARGENRVLDDEEEIVRERIDIETIHSDSDLIKVLKYVRIILDLGTPADVLTQIAGISGGIPQVNLYSSSYVKHEENGWILDDISDFEEALLYYLTNLEHWNQSLVHSVKKIEQYTRGEIVDMWKNTIKELKGNEKISVLQIADENWQEQYEIPSNIKWTFVKPEDIVSLLPEDIGILNREVEAENGKKKKKKVDKPFDVVLVDTAEYLEYVTILDQKIQVYRLFYHERCQINTKTLERFLLRKKAVKTNFENPEQMLHIFSRGFFSKQNGTKLSVNHLVAAPSFEGQISYEGTNYLRLCGRYGEDYQTIATYQHNVFLSGEMPLDLWPEFRVSEGCSIRYVVKGFPAGNSPMQEWIYDETSFDRSLTLDVNDSYYLSISIQAKGQGIVKLGPCHYRDSHLGYGDLLVGGKRISDKNREELIYFFHPGDLKPPLNIYFSGYRPAEGFEGYWMMNNLGSPFLLVGDPRSEGGAFYLGSEELEQKLLQVVHNCLDELGFTKEQLTLSGLSMGTFGALYYSSKLEPHAVIVGKPLVNLGDMAENESTIRPGGFPTSLDLVYRTIGELSSEATAQLNERFWTAFESADFSKTKFIISFMYQDDYDMSAYPDMLDELGQRDYRVSVISKGLTGRHNDDTQGIVEWFFNQYKTLLMNSFEREFKS